MNRLILFVCLMCCNAVLFDWLINAFFYACQVNSWYAFTHSCNWSWHIFFQNFTVWFKCLVVVLLAPISALMLWFIDFAIEVLDGLEHFFLHLGTVSRFV
ncbi:nonstructural protein NS8 [Rhinolophus affinis bat coronavirus HKU2-related]|nr:nonstructural protein NS8 [Rhinolophus affinis bat coronavirus HKU2-related]